MLENIKGYLIGENGLAIHYLSLIVLLETYSRDLEHKYV